MSGSVSRNVANNDNTAIAKDAERPIDWDAAAKQMADRHQAEYETVHNGSGLSDELPSELDRRQSREYDRFEAMREQATGPSIQPAATPVPPQPAPPPPALRTYLDVPFAEKDAAKKAGARWDIAEKKWFAPPGAPLDGLARWLPEKVAARSVDGRDPHTEFGNALREAGLRLPGPPEMDGVLHRVPVEGDKRGAKSGAYVGHLDGRPAGFIQNYTTGLAENWSLGGALTASGTAMPRLAADAVQKREERAEERDKAAQAAAGTAEALWNAAAPASKGSYLEKKGAEAIGLREGRYGQNITLKREDGREYQKSIAGSLIVPVHGEDGKLSSLQFIAEDGNKMFLAGGKMSGGHFVLGDVKTAGPLLIAEGYATAATVHELTKQPVVVAFNSGNLGKVAELYRARHPERAIFIAGDDDRTKQAEGKPNVGRIKAEEAAARVGGKALFPIFPVGVQGTDWNDLAKSQGKETAQILIQAAVRVGTRQLQSERTPQATAERRPNKQLSRGSADLER